MRGTMSEGMSVVPGYRLVEFLGKGGFGEVWKAIGPGKVPLALKIIELKGSKSGQREFRSLDLLRELRHPNLLPLQGYWLLDENGTVLEDEHGEAATLVIAMLLGERSLRQRLEECQKAGSPGIPVDELMEYMRDAAKAIDFLNSPRHDFGSGPVSIQHRDIKPENLLIVGGGVMLADFGISRVLGSDSDMVMTETAAMTIWYAAPELFDFKASIWTDQYALAITYFELRAGQLPFPSGATPTKVMATHLKGAHDLSAVSPAEQAALRRATAIVPQERYPTCIELIADLATALQQESQRSPRAVASAASAAAQTGGSSASASKQLDFLVRTTGQSSKSLSAAVGPSASHATESLSNDFTQPERPGDQTSFFGDENRAEAATDVSPAAARAPQESPPATPRRSLAAIVAVVAVVVALPLAFWAGTRFFRDSSQGTPVSDSAAGQASSERPKSDDRSATHIPAADPIQTARVAAAAALEKGNFPQVISALEPVIRGGHGTADDHRNRARAWLRLADLDDDPPANLRNAAADFAAADEPEQQVETLMRLGRWLERNGRPREAVKQFLELVELERAAESLVALASAHIVAGQADAAREIATEALELAGQSDGPDSKRVAAQAHRALGRAFKLLGDSLDRSEPRDADAVADADRHVETHLAAAVAAADELELAEAKAWRNELEQFRDTPRVAAQIMARQLQMRVAELRRQLSESPADPRVLLKLAEAEAAAGDVKAADRHFVEGHSRQAIEFARSGKTVEAESAIARATERDAEHPLIHFARGLVFDRKGDDDGAIRALDAAIKGAKDEDGDRWRFFAARASVRARRAARSNGPRELWDAPERDAAAALESGPRLTTPGAGESPTDDHRDFARLYHIRAEALDSLAGSDRTPAAAKLLDDAGQAALKAMSFDAEDVRYPLTAARVLLRRAGTVPADQTAAIQQQAEEMIARAIALDERSAEAQDLRGELSLVQGNVVAARAAFEKALGFAEQASDSRTLFSCAHNLAFAYLRAPVDNEKALAAADRAIAAAKDDPAGHFARGLALRNLKRSADAIAAFDAALAVQPKHVGSLLAKSQLTLESPNAKADDLAQANKDIDEAFAAATDEQKPEAHYVRSLSRLKTHIANAAKPAVAEPALIEAQRDLVQSVKLMPANTIYSSAAAELFAYAARYSWKDAKLKSESEKLQQELKAARNEPPSNDGD